MICLDSMLVGWVRTERRAYHFELVMNVERRREWLA